MSSELSSSLSQSSITNNDEFGELDVTDFDASALWELLGEEDANKDGVATQAMEVMGPKPDSVMYSCGPLDNDNNNGIQDMEWFHTMEETETLQCNDIGEWACMEEIFEMGDYSLSYINEIMSDEIGYIGLWQDSWSYDYSGLPQEPFNFSR